MLALKRRCSIMLFFVVASAAPVAMRIAPAAAASANAPANTPEQLISSLLAAAHAGDIDGYLALLTAASRDALTQSVANQAAMRRANESFLLALNNRFGEGTPVLSDPPDDLKTALSGLVETQILSQKAGEHGDVELRVKTTIKFPSAQAVTREQTLLAHQEDGRWKLALGLVPDGGLVSAQIATAERITQDVRDGKYKDRQAAMIAMANAWTPGVSK